MITRLRYQNNKKMRFFIFLFLFLLTRWFFGSHVHLTVPQPRIFQFRFNHSDHSDTDPRVCGAFNDAPLVLNFGVFVSESPGEQEKLHYHHTSHEFYIYLSGEAIIEVDQQVFELRAGKILMIPPFLPHRVLRHPNCSSFFPTRVLVIRTHPLDDKILLKQK